VCQQVFQAFFPIHPINAFSRSSFSCAVSLRKLTPMQEIGTHKLNLKADGPDCKMIFKFGRHIERLYSARKQCVCLYKHHLRCKILVGNTQTRELHPMDAGCAIASLIRSNSSQPYIIAHTPDQDVKCRSGHLHLRKQPLHDSFCTGHCSTLFINS
jgi:hypothetical protein